MKLSGCTSTVPAAATRPTIIAPQIEQHQVLGTFLGIGEQACFVGGHHPRANAHADACRRWGRMVTFAVTYADKNLGAGTDQRKARQIEEIEEGRRVYPPQRAIQ